MTLALWILAVLAVGWAALNFIISVLATHASGDLNWRMFISAGHYEQWVDER